MTGETQAWPRTAAAIQANMRRAAVRGAADPERLAKARRTVVAAVAAGRLTLFDLAEEVDRWKSRAT